MCVFVLGHLTTISPFIYLPFYFFAATTKCLYKRHLFPTLSLSLSGVPHTISPFLYLPFYFFAATTKKCLYKQHLLPTSLLASIILRCDHGPDSLHAVIWDKLTFFTGGCSEGLGAFRFFFKITTAPQSPPPTLEAR